MIELSMRRPRGVLVAWLALVAALGLAGFGVERRLRLADPIVPGSASSRAHNAASRAFGEESAFIALLQGNASALGRGGPRIVDALSRIPAVSAVSPWLPGAPRALRPNGQTAIVVLGAHQPFERAGVVTAPRIRATLARAAPRSIAYHVVGYADVTAAIRRAAFSGLAQAELIAALLLGALLLLVFRGPIAAGVPLFLGLSTVAGVRGLLVAINAWVLPLDITALSLASMFGLALGVDYSLLLVSRFREHLAAGEAPADAARTAAMTAGHTVWIAGAALACALAALYTISPENVTASGSIGGLAAVAMSVAGAQIALPALLVLLGANVNRWQFARGERSGGRLASLAWRAIDRPMQIVVPALILLLALCSQSIAVRLSPPHDTSLPADSATRADVRAIDRRLGSGWVTPYEVTIVARHGPITDPRTLYAMTRWQERLARSPSVAAVMGPQTVYGTEGPPSADGSYASQALMGLELLRDAPASQREALDLVVNLSRGGTALRMYVIERTGTGASLSGDRAALPGDPLRRRLTRDAEALERSTGARILVGGPAATLQDFTSSDQALIPMLVMALSAITFLLLLVWTRALAIALAAVALNVVTVAAALGVLVLCFQRPAPFGAPDDLGAAVVPGVIAVSFALAIDYEVFLLARVREGIAITGGVEEGLRHALRRTAGVITGAAAIMCGVFAAFATAGLADLREYGVGLATAVTIDATIVRLLLLPAVIRLLGRRAWWLPSWLAWTLHHVRFLECADGRSIGRRSLERAGVAATHPESDAIARGSGRRLNLSLRAASGSGGQPRAARKSPGRYRHAQNQPHRTPDAQEQADR